MNKRGSSLIGILCCMAMITVGCGKDSANNEEQHGVTIEKVAKASTESGTESGSYSLETVTTQGKTEETSTDSQSTAAKKSPLDGKKVSILGDSISTYTGYIPSDYSIFYPENGGITDVKDTWWMRVIDGSNAVFCADASYSGSTTSGVSTEQNDGRPGVSDRRIGDLTSPDGMKPDVILVYMGANDLLVNIPIGDNDGTRTVAEGDIENFTDAYTLMLDKVKKAYPDAQVYCITFHEICRWDESGNGFTFKSDTGFISSQYNDKIVLIAKNKGLPLIDVFNGCGINPDNAIDNTLDGTHPNAAGAKKIADYILSALDEMAE